MPEGRLEQRPLFITLLGGLLRLEVSLLRYFKLAVADDKDITGGVALLANNLVSRELFLLQAVDDLLELTPSETLEDRHLLEEQDHLIQVALVGKRDYLLEVCLVQGGEETLTAALDARCSDGLLVVHGEC